MNQNSLNNGQMPGQENEKNIDVVKILFLMLSNWYWFMLALGITVGAAWLYKKFTLPTWKVTATVLIEEDQKNKSIIGSEKLLEGFGVRPGMQNLDNQLLILTSWTVIEKTLAELPFDVEYYHHGRVNKADLYPFSPIKVNYDKSGKIPKDIEFKFNMLNTKTFSLSAHNDLFNFETQASFGDTIVINGGKMIIERAQEGLTGEIDRSLYFVLNSRDNLVENYRSRLKAAPSSKEGTIIILSLEGTNKVKDVDFMNKLIDVFLNNNLERKNNEAVRTVNFIDEQLMGISDSLKTTEDKLQKFKSANKVMDLSAQGAQIITQAMTLENEKARLVIESNYYDYLADYLSKDVSAELPVSPATMGITDAGLTKLVLELADLQGEYFSKSIGEKNPMQTQIYQRLLNIRQALNETLKGVRMANSIALKENSSQISLMNASAVNLPKTERELLGFEREFKLNDVLYSFLLEKKAESQIQKASNSPDNEIVDRPRPGMHPVAPKSMIMYLFAMMGGLGIPFVVILVIQALNNTIKDEEDLYAITDLPIAGYIPHNNLETHAAVRDKPSSEIAESYRSLRSRIKFFTKEIKSPVILVTSSMAEEGKTFTAINLASVYSLMDKKTILIGFDLRRPKVCSELGISNESGVSTWFVEDISIDKLIVKTKYNNLDLLPSGTIPPNPAELIASEKTPELISELRKRYDYIIIDSAPIGTVSDSITLATMADATLILVRHGKTIGPLLSNTLLEVEANGIKGLSLLVNDIRYGKMKYRYYSRYGNDYRNNYRSKSQD
jgi:tyrosine-protein kinase Etk/Wzc